MDKELALRTFAYLIGHYKTHDETIINSQEIEAIEFILNETKVLEQQCKKQKEIIDKIKKEVNEQHTIMGCEVVENWVLLQILEDKEVL